MNQNFSLLLYFFNQVFQTNIFLFQVDRNYYHAQVQYPLIYDQI